VIALLICLTAAMTFAIKSQNQNELQLPPLNILSAGATDHLSEKNQLEKQTPELLTAAWAQVPLYFEEHRDGKQLNYYIARGTHYTLGIAADSITLMSQRAENAPIKMQFLGAHPSPLKGHAPLKGKVNYLKGNHPEYWQTDISTYAVVQQKQIYPGVDVHYYGKQGRLEYDFIVAPETDFSQIQLSFEGVDSLELDNEGNLLLKTEQGILQQNKPQLYQEIAGKRQVIEGRYQLLSDNKVGFKVEQYNQQYALVIDPVLVYSSYLGGGKSDSGIAISVDEQGSAYVLGQTRSTSLLFEDGVQSQLAGKTDLFIAKFNPAGNALEYATYLGGSDDDLPRDLTIDDNGYAYIVGMTRSTDFPINNAIQATHKGGRYDTFITKLSPEGNQLDFSTYLGGGNIEQGNSIALDADNNIYITGTTRSSDFPTINAFQSTLAGNYDAYISKISNDGSQLIYSTFIGGNSREISRAIAVDSRGHATITGYTASRSDFPLQNEIQSTNAGRYDAFITQLTADGQALNYSSYLGGRGTDGGLGIAIDSQDNAIIVGVSNAGRRRGTSQNYPLKNALQATRGGRNDGVVTKFSADGELLFSTYLGGNRADNLRNVAIDADDNILVIGSTSSKIDIPIVDPIQSELNKNRTDVYLAKLSSDGSEILFGSYFGGKRSDNGIDIAENGQDIYIVGSTTSGADFPLQEAYQASLGGKTDLFVAKIGPENYPPEITSEAITIATKNQQYSYLVEASDADEGDKLEYSLINGPVGMGVNSDSGLITWFANIIGDIEVEVSVTDEIAYTTQSFTLTVSEEVSDFSIISTAVIKAAIGFPYIYDVNTNNNNADLKFELEIAPVGMLIDDSTGEITWTPTSVGSFPVLVQVEDEEGGVSDSQNFRITVVELDTSPLTITFTSPNAQGGFITNNEEQTVTGFLSRSGAVLTVDGRTITLADDNSFSFDVTLREANGNLDDIVNMFKLSYSYHDNDFGWISMGVQYLHMTLDKLAPSIVITSPQQNLITRVSSQTILGRLSETAELTINGLPVVIEADNRFELVISLTEGSNAIILTATDNAGNVTTNTLTLVLDTTAPIITVNSVQNGLITRTPIQSITGTLNEAATFSINGVPVTVTGDYSFNFAISLAQGSNVVELESTDIIGNTSTKTLILTLDTIAPTMTISSHQDGLVTQQAGQILAGSIGEVASLTIDGSAVTVAGDNSFNQSIVLNEGDNLFTFIVTDEAGNETSSLLTLTLDTLAPVITVTSPQNNQTTELPQQIITGNLSETASLLINGETVTIAQDNSFQYDVILVEGINSYSLVATDALGNENIQTLTLTLDSGGMLIISITSPNDGAVTNQVSQNITGSLNLAGTLTINGEAVTVEADNSFSHAAILNEGSNSFTIEGVFSGGDVVAKTITIILDTIAPDISISSPIDGETTTQSQQSIKGSLSEVASLTINGADVPLNGITKILNLGTAAENTNGGLSVLLDRTSGSYNVAGQVVVGSDNSFNIAVPLSQGENTFVITATDQAGNTTTKTLTINK
jgi:hypothetical protein